MTALVVPYPALRELHIGVEAICRDADVTPKREEDSGAMAAARRATDASRLTFPLQLVIIICGGVMATTGAFWVANAQLRSDVRDIKTAMDGIIQSQSLQISGLRRDIDDERREQALQKVRLEETRNSLSEIKGFLTGSGIIKGSAK